ncbi:MAG: LysM peptidoglycan-binding domain-containing protein [Clostridia bacterium]|nr:LysM peptidoglycan-binding domain-containing protein [Clostridia bacterium]
MFKPSVIEACTPIEYVAVIVKQGDSLWSIADKYDNNTTDIRRYIDTIQQYNQIDNTDILQPGDIINVPIY